MHALEHFVHKILKNKNLIIYNTLCLKGKRVLLDQLLLSIYFQQEKFTE